MFQLAQMPDFKLWKAHQPTGVKTRSSKKKLLTLRKPKNEKYKRVSKLWNSLPEHLQKMDSYHEYDLGPLTVRDSQLIPLLRHLRGIT